MTIEISIYKKESGGWIFDGYATPSGTWRMKIVDGLVNFREVGSKDDKYVSGIPVTSILKEDGSPYQDVETFQDAVSDFFVNPLNPLEEAVEGLQEAMPLKADLVNGLIPAEQLPSYVDDVLNIEHWSDTEPVALEDELWYDTVNNDLSVYDGEAWIAVVMDYGRIYVNVDTTSDSYNSTFRYNGVSLILLGANVTREFLEGILVTRTVALAAYDIDMALGEDFTKTCAAASVFTISNPIIKKSFRMFITGGTLGTPLFTGYTDTWIASTLIGDYNPAIVNVLVCEIRAAGEITLFWGA
jgi:hypothetical protein